MFSMFEKIQLSAVTTFQQYFLLFVQITIFSATIVILFDAIWSATIFLPLSVAAEIVAKILISHAVNRFV